MLARPLVGLALSVTDRHAVIAADVQRWSSVLGPMDAATLVRRHPEFRNLLYHRLRHGRRGRIIAKLLQAVYRPESTLHLDTREIGPGLFIQHGFATIVAAERIGANCWINQQVTIGYRTGDGRPRLGDGVLVGAGAKVLGAVHVGDGARVGANAVVVKDVEPGITVVGVPASPVR